MNKISDLLAAAHGRFEGSAVDNGDMVAAHGSRTASQFLSVSWPAARGAQFELLA